MSHIIECPACSTRYKLNKPIPEGGRPVKCARCGHQWQLVLEVEASEMPEVKESAYGQDAFAAGHESSEHQADFTTHRQDNAWEDEAARHNVPPSEDENTAPVPDWQARGDRFAATISTLSEPQSVDYGSVDEHKAETASDYNPETRWRDQQEADPEINPAGESQEADEFYSKGLSFLNRAQNEPRTGDDGDQDIESSPDSSSGWTSRIMRPWRSRVEAARAESADNDEADTQDTESAIRQALKHALQHPEEIAEQTRGLGESSAQAYAGRPEEEPRPDRFSGSVGEDHRQSADPFETDRDSRSAFEGNGGSSTFSFANFAPEKQPYQENDQEEEESDPPFRLTGKNARLPIFGSGRSYDEEEYEKQGDHSQEEAFQNDGEDPFGLDDRDDGAPRSAPPNQTPYDESPDDFTRLYERQFEQDVDDSDTRGDLNEDLAELQAELEGTDIATYEQKQGGGGLATAAAWAVFISVMSGVILALISLRQDIMIALPGTTQLYKTLGFDVAERGVDFADVRYRWTTAEGKPMIEVTGQVVNVTDRAVKVPRVLVNVRDAAGTDSVTATASVPAEELAPRETTSFTLEFLSPPENVTQIELAFDHDR